MENFDYRSILVDSGSIVQCAVLQLSLHLKSSCQGPSHQADVEEEDWKTNAGNANLEVR